MELSDVKILAESAGMHLSRCSDANGNPAFVFALQTGESGKCCCDGEKIVLLLDGEPADLDAAPFTEADRRAILAMCLVMAHGGSGSNEATRIPIWLEFAAKHGSDEAAFELGIFLHCGDFDHAVDLKQARAWFQHGARAGNLDCKVMLASMLLAGEGGKPNKKEGLKLAEEVAEQGSFDGAALFMKHAFAPGELPAPKVLLRFAQLLPRIRTTENLEDPNQREILADMERIVGQAVMRQKASSKKKAAANQEESLRWLRLSAFDGCVESMIVLARLGIWVLRFLKDHEFESNDDPLTEEDIPVNKEETLALLTAAAELGNAEAMLRLAEFKLGMFDNHADYKKRHTNAKKAAREMDEAYVWCRRALERVNELKEEEAEELADFANYLCPYVESETSNLDRLIKAVPFKPKDYSEIRIYPDAQWNRPYDPESEGGASESNEALE